MILEDGCIWCIDISAAVDQCKDMGYEEQDIIIDVAVCGDKQMEQEEITSKNAVSNFLRSMDLGKFYKSTNSIVE